MKSRKRFVILSGPACVGKGPLQEAVNKFYPNLISARPILCHSRHPRVERGEIHGQHYYFLPPAFISSLQSNADFAVSKVRSDWQAIDLLQIENLLHGNDVIFAELFHTFGEIIRDRLPSRDFTFYSIFLFPCSPDTQDHIIIKTLKTKLINRGTEKEPKLTERAKSAPEEMRSAHNYTHRILNLATEDDIEEWGEFGTREGKCGERKIHTVEDLGNNARWLVETFVNIAKGEIPPLGPSDRYLSPLESF